MLSEFEYGFLSAVSQRLRHDKNAKQAVETIATGMGRFRVTSLKDRCDLTFSTLNRYGVLEKLLEVWEQLDREAEKILQGIWKEQE